MATRTRKKKQAKASRLATAASAAPKQLLDMVHQVWLAGLGAAARAQSGAPKIFDELVEEGARVHAGVSKVAEKTVRDLVTRTQAAFQGGVSDAREKASDTLEGLEKMFQTRVQRALQQIGVPSSREIDRLSARVETLNANIEKLARKRVTGSRARSNGKRATSAGASA